MAASQEENTVGVKVIIASFSQEVHVLLEIAAMSAKDNLQDGDSCFSLANVNTNEYPPTAQAIWLKFLAAVLYIDTTSRKFVYEIQCRNESLIRRKWKPEFYRFLESCLKPKSIEEGKRASSLLLRRALGVYYSCPEEGSPLELQILNIIAEGVQTGMSQQTEEFLLNKTSIQGFIEQLNVEGELDETQERLVAKFRSLVEGDQHPTVGYTLDKLTERQREYLIKETSKCAPSPAMLIDLQGRSSSYVLANDKIRGKMYGIVCYNEFEKCDDEMRRREATEEAESIIKAMKDAGINVKPFKNWNPVELQDQLKIFCKRVKDRCSAVFVCIMSHGFKGVIFGNNSKEEVYTINQTLQVVEKELPDMLPKVIIVQACQGSHCRNSWSSAGDALAVGKEYPHIEVTTPETMLLMSTVYGETSNRNHFIPALAEYLGKPDGKTSLHEMFTMAITECQRQQRMDADYDVQKPLFITSAKNVIIPKAQ